MTKVTSTTLKIDSHSNNSRVKFKQGGFTVWQDVLVGEPTEDGAWTLDYGAVPEHVWRAAPTVSVKDAILTLQTDDGFWQMPAMPTDVADWGVNRDIYSGLEDRWITGDDLREGWKPLISAMGKDRSRPGLCALEVAINAGIMSAVAIDGYRLACWEKNISYFATDGIIAFPADAVRWLDKQRHWGWQIYHDSIWCMGYDFLLQATPVLGFPDCRTILSNLLETATCKLDAKGLAAAVKRCTIGKEPRRVRLDWGDGTLRLTSRSNASTTSAAATLAAETDGSATLLLDPTLLHPMLAALGRQPCTLYSQGPNRPLYVRCKGKWGDCLLLQALCDK